MFCGDLNGKEIKKRGDVYICRADSHCSTAETNMGFPGGSEHNTVKQLDSNKN